MFATLLASLLVAHMVADYPLQPDWVASNKHTDTDALVSHAVVHGATASVLSALFVDVGVAAAIAIPLAFVHGAIDRFDLHIRWDQTAHLASVLAFSIAVYPPV